MLNLSGILLGGFGITDYRAVKKNLNQFADQKRFEKGLRLKTLQRI